MASVEDDGNDDISNSLPKAKFLSKNQRKRRSNKAVEEKEEDKIVKESVKKLFPKEKRGLFTTSDYVQKSGGDSSDQFATQNDFMEKSAAKEEKPPLKEPTKRRTPTKKKPVWTSKRREQKESKEWGPSIRGYRFVGTGEEEQMTDMHHAKYKYMKHSDIYDSQTYNDGYGTSVPEQRDRPLPEHIDDIYKPTLSFDDCQKARYETIELTYDEYIKKWESWETGDAIIWPVASLLYEDVNIDQISLFLNNKDKVKKERVRWHPDKMNLKIQSSVKVSDKVTKTFQLINEIWEQKYGN